ALGRFFAKLAVSALIFDYLLTGPISGVSAGQYIVGLLLDSLRIIDPNLYISDPATRGAVKSWGSVLIACAITLYFFRLNLRGIHESSDRALKIMIATTVMGAIILVWSLATLAINGPATYQTKDGQTVRNQLPLTPDFSPKPPRVNEVTGVAEEQP